MNAAIFITKQYGGDALTVKNICEVAQVSNGSFYHLFSGKEDLVYYYLSYAFQKYRETLSRDTIGLTARECILLSYDYYLRVCEDVGHEFISVVYSTSNKSLNYFERPQSQSLILDMIQTYLHRGVRAGEFKEDLDMDDAIFGIASIVTGVVFYWCVFDGKHIDLRAKVASLLSAYIDLLEA